VAAIQVGEQSSACGGQPLGFTRLNEMHTRKSEKQTTDIKSR
jgi:hypothetical protein